MGPIGVPEVDVAAALICENQNYIGTFAQNGYVEFKFEWDEDLPFIIDAYNKKLLQLNKVKHETIKQALGQIAKALKKRN